MIKPCDAVWLCVAAIWSAPSPATFQTAHAQPIPPDGPLSDFQVGAEFDLDALIAAGDLRALEDDPVLDARFRFDAERVLADGRRWGMRAAAAVNTGDGRRGFSQALGAGPVIEDRALSGLATGFVSAPGLDPGSGRAGATAAEFYLIGRWIEWRAGFGATAAKDFNADPASALRLARADRALADLAGGGLSHTGLSLSAPAIRVAVETRRIAGFALAASFTPDAERCGIDQCRLAQAANVASPDVSDLASIAVSFDRRSPQSRVRWAANFGVEHGQVDYPGVGFEDPWIITASARRERDGVTIGLSALHSNDGLDQDAYTAISGLAALERGAWFYSLEIAHGKSGAFDVDGFSIAAGASRWMTDNALVSIGFVAHEVGGSGAMLETGLRF
jgi:hypothetical protein